MLVPDLLAVCLSYLYAMRSSYSDQIFSRCHWYLLLNWIIVNNPSSKLSKTWYDTETYSFQKHVRHTVARRATVHQHEKQRTKWIKYARYNCAWHTSGEMYQYTLASQVYLFPNRGPYVYVVRPCHCNRIDIDH